LGHEQVSLLERYRADMKLWFMHPLRHIIGNRVFRRALRRWTRRCPSHGISAMEILLREQMGEKIDSSCEECRRFLRSMRFFYRLVKALTRKKPFESDETEAIASRWMSLKTSAYVRGVYNVFDGIARFGFPLPIATGAPLEVVWEITGMCNLHCPYCFARDGRGVYGMSTEECLKLIDQLSEANVVAVSLSGGEPLLRKDFFSIAEHATEKGLYISMATNGTLIDRETSRRLKEIGVSYVEISLDNPVKEVHEKIRGLGSFNKAVNAAKYCVEAGIPLVGFGTTLSARNKDVRGVLDFAKNVGVNQVVFLNFIPTRGAVNDVNFDMDPMEREEVLKEISRCQEAYVSCFRRITALQSTYMARIAHEMTGKSKNFRLRQIGFSDLSAPKAHRLANIVGGCGAGRTYAAIASNGDIMPCVFLPIKLGNVKRDSFIDVWRSSPVLKQMRDRGNWKGLCRTCDYRIVCGGCRARSYAYLGDFLAPDPGCKLNAGLFYRLKEKHA